MIVSGLDRFREQLDEYGNAEVYSANGNGRLFVHEVGDEVVSLSATSQATLEMAAAEIIHRVKY
ncbi:hypothetical protein [Noviherbaspirillum autotrophicum]|uniref:Uncharacterized protein n=1 Tax=Noviherbaspirillum autotrophicum TaxID=709839 RepID=A0A0C2BUF9_9BURK|nr:hypothetical protein [Noviherbaspirillum autotrophicum]KIF81676.1 hypothetical protein TSA66_14185 [Noviherbaspirillum autotrophicum]KIF82037.1 hypothetical protein TSA66_16520 [Noviherbaspirillum autotrophicum]KIF84077.1 hypothetical protein TSA66_00510 [Noviherbaspirillum autotrophicum]